MFTYVLFVLATLREVGTYRYALCIEMCQLVYIQYSSSIVDSKQTVEDFDQEPDVFVFCSVVDPDSGSAWILPLVRRILIQVVKNYPQECRNY
jgi:hypothetical protein